MKALVLDGEWDPQEGYDLSPTERETHRSMNAAKTWRHPELAVEERERPEPADDEILVRTRYVGVCGSDISMAAAGDDGYMHYSAYASLPNVVGHEFAGEVVETGDDARIFSPGDLVTAEVTDYCCRCGMCRQGFHGHCENFEQLGFTVPGAAAEYVAVPEKIAWSVDPLREAYDDTDDLLRAAATVEPSTITYYGMFGRADGVWPGDYYAFHGMGPIGLTGMNVARAAGAGRVIGFEPSEPRREIARDLGFEHVYDPIEEDPRAVIERVTGGEGVDVHVETSGAVRQTYPVIEDTLAERANVVHISNAGTSSEVDTRKYQGNAAQLYGSEGHTGQQIFPRVIRLMAAGQLDNLPLITSTYGITEGVEAVERAAERVDGKVLIEV
jgi:threonine dehydrogenase-like Zn-dependent dehydrogenase